MRLIGQLKGEREAFTFYAFLQKEEIGGSFEPTQEENTFNIWIENEDDVKAASHWMDLFKKNPEDPRFSVDPHPIDRHTFDEVEEKEMAEASTVVRRVKQTPKRIVVTHLLIFLCVSFYFWNSYELTHLEKVKSGARFFNLTPLFINFCYDVPATFPLLITFFNEHPVETLKDLENLSSAAQLQYEAIEKAPVWTGIYTILLEWPKGNEALRAPMFVMLQKGQIWRLFTPCLLHGGFLHILFNMLWLFLLGRQVEERIKVWQYLIITVMIGAISNTAQYLVSGPLFIGYSGVITGLGGFIWMRQRLAPWEGYPLNRATVVFLALFIFGMLALQIVSFVLTRFNLVHFPMNIANTAHITGALTGALLGRLPFLARGNL